MVKDMLYYVWSLVIATGAILPSRVTYGGDGVPGSSRQSWVDPYDGEQSVDADDDVAQSGVVNYLHTGRSFMQIEIIPSDTGSRYVEVVIQYFEREADILVQTGQDRMANQQFFDYVPSPLLWNIPVNRQKGTYVRVRSIFNKGDSTFVAKVRCPSSVEPVEDSVTIQERDVIENSDF